VEINSVVYVLKSYIRQVPLFTSGGLGLYLVILVLVLKQRLRLGLVILVLVLRIWSCLHHWYWEISLGKQVYGT